MIRFACSHCGNAVAVREKFAGKTGKCTKCGNEINVPTLADSVASTPRPIDLSFAPPLDQWPALERSPVRRRRGGKVFLTGLLFYLAGAVALAAWMRPDLLHFQPSPLPRDPSTRNRRENSHSAAKEAISSGKLQKMATSGKRRDQSSNVSRTTDGVPKVLGLDAGASPAASPPHSEPAIVSRSPFVPSKPDRDETDEGRERIRQIQEAAQEIGRERDRIEIHEKRPLQIPRDRLAAEISQLEHANAESQEEIYARTTANQLLAAQRNAEPNNGLRQMYDQQIADNNQVIAHRRNSLNFNNQQIANKRPQILALENQLAPINARLRKLMEQMIDARKQWLDAHELREKYARGDYERLRGVLDAWLLIDGLWPEAHCWAALCAYELGELQSADDYCSKARSLYQEQIDRSKPNPQIRALEGLIWMKREGASARAKDALAEAERLSRKKKSNDWQTFFLVGRAWADRPFEADQRKALAKFNDALKHDPECRCAEIAKARLQTTTRHEKLKDLEQGIATLERHWKSTGERSWRLAVDLARAYRAAGNSAASASFCEAAFSFAPLECREDIERILSGDADPQEKKVTPPEFGERSHSPSTSAIE